MPTEQRCVTCGAELAAFATEGFCSACLLERGLTGAPTEALPLRSFGDYELIEEIARGGMGVVYKARQAGLNRIVAVKMILSGQFASTAETQRFRAEARSAAALQHPGIVAIHEVGEHDGLVYFSMDFVEGHNLAQLIRDGPWSAARAAQCVRDIAAAIHYAHEHGVLHRDLKPSNVLIDANGKPRVTDFGLAKRLVAAEVTRLTSALSPGGEGRGEGGRSSEPKEDQSLLTSAATEELTLSGQVLGSPNFMPPEQAAGKHRELTPASDVYSLGALLYHLLTGRPPFLADNIPATLRLVSETEPVAPRLLVPTVPRDLETICLKCLDKNPRHRYATAQELSDELARFLRDEPIRARPVAPAEKLARWARRNPKVAGLSAALVVVLAAGFAGVLVQLQRANRHAAAETHERDRAERTAREEARTRVQAEELLRQLQMQRAEDLLAGDRASAALLILTERLRSHPSDAGAAHRVLWELGRRDFALPLGPALTHSQYVAMARFSADGHRVLTASFAGTARVWNAHTGEPLTPFMAHDASIMGAAFSPDGTRVVTCAADGTVRVWDGHTGQPLMPVLRHSAVVHWVAFSPDGLQFVSAGEDAARIWETQTGRLRHELSEHQGPVVFAIFSPDGKKVVTAAHDGTARIWRTKDGKPAVPALAHPVFVKGAYFSPDGTLVVTWSNDSCVRVWSANTGELVSGPLAHENDVCEATFSADSQRIVSGAWDRTAQVWEARTGKKLTRTLPHPSGVTTARFDASGDRVVTACWDGSARIWNAHTGQPLSEPFRQGQGLRWAEFSPDGERVVTASRDHSAQLWNLRANQMSSEPLPHGAPVVSAAFSPNGRWLATAAKDGMVRLWDFRSGQPAGPALPHESEMISLCFSPDSRLLATSVQDGPARIWEASPTRLIAGPLQHETNAPVGTVPPPVIAFSPDGRKLATCSYDRKQGKALIWDVSTGRLLASPLVHQGWIGAVDFSPDGHWFATASWYDTGRIWDVTSDNPRNASWPLERNVVSVHFSSDGGRVLAASADQSARIWDRRTGKVQVGPVFHANAIRAARFSPDDRSFITTSIDGARIWDAQTGQPRTDPLPHDGSVTAVRFHPGGAWLLTVAQDRNVRLWNATNGQPLTASVKWNGTVAAAEFLGGGVMIAVVSPDHSVRVWEGPLWDAGVPDWIGPLAEAIAGQRSGAKGIVEPVSASEFLALRQQILAALQTDASASWIKRFLSAPAIKPNSPTSSVYLTSPQTPR